MSMVERLAEKARRDEATVLGCKDAARWWLNAIADELVTNLDTPMAASVADVSEWLRDQAREDK
jgi:hypothetical protein